MSLSRVRIESMFPACFTRIVACQERLTLQLRRTTFQKRWHDIKWRIELRATLEEHFHRVVVIGPPHPITKRIETIADWSF